MSTRTRRRSGKGSRWVILLALLLAGAVLLMLMMPMLVMGRVRAYLQEKAFRDRMEQLFGSRMQASVRLAPLRWTGDEVTAPEAHVATASGWEARLDGLHLALDWNAFRQGTWRTVGTGADSLVVEKKITASLPADLSQPQPQAPSSVSGPAAGPTADIPAWLRRYLPTRTEVDGVTVDRLSILHPGPWYLREARLRAAPWKEGESSLSFSVENGRVETPLVLPSGPDAVQLKLARATVRLSPDDLHLKEAVLHWPKGGEVVARGHSRPVAGTWEVATHVSGLPLGECLAEDWRLRLSGQAAADLILTGGLSQEPLITGQMQLREGVLTALPVLDRLAAYTGVERFKRLVLDTASASLHLTSGECRFENILLQSNGLLSLEGSLTVRGQDIEGSFWLGVTPETLKWIPGAQQHVFTTNRAEGPPGMVWTPLRISGTLDAPREDLSPRLAAGAGKAVLDAPGQIVGQGSELLLEPLLGKDRASMPGEAVKEATDATGKAMESGIKLLEGIGSGLLGR